MGNEKITLPADLLHLVEHWTAEGTMKFRWPSDDEVNFKAGGDRWGGVGVALELTRLNPEDAIKAVLQKNEGPAIEAFAAYWRDVPARNVDDLLTSFKVVSAALLAMNAALIAYKQTSIEQLAELKKELDENQKWAWLPWSDDKKIHEHAQRIIGSFDDLNEYDVDDFNGTMNNCLALIKKEQALYDGIRDRFTPAAENAGQSL
ncbi:hypothetical protein [Actinomadura sp. DC4]|uniref:hypothetical protein n=1 Tax=Actinomadura sp. DC4 TaxID=3055069 RepID=UPI0025B20577|nr:hypothetical protein [Actinomadura sp. DC4]MDN3354411.1 hypothetical protein [Actinomadura sp. DC4]